MNKILYSGEHIDYNGNAVSVSSYTISILSVAAFNAITSSTINSGLYNPSPSSLLGPDQVVLLGSNDGTNWIGLGVSSNLSSVWNYVVSSLPSTSITIYVDNPQPFSYYRLVFTQLCSQSFSLNPASSTSLPNSGIALSGFTMTDTNQVMYSVFPLSTVIPGNNNTYLQVSNYPAGSNGIRTYKGTISTLASVAPNASRNPVIPYSGEFLQYNENPFVLRQYIIGIPPVSLFNSTNTALINTGIYNATPTSILGPNQIILLGSNDSITWTGLSNENNLTSLWQQSISQNPTLPGLVVPVDNTTAYSYYRFIFPTVCSQNFSIASTTPPSTVYPKAAVVLSSLSLMDNITNIYYLVFPQSTSLPSSGIAYAQINNYTPSVSGSIRTYTGSTTTLSSYAPVGQTITVGTAPTQAPFPTSVITPSPAPTVPGSTVAPTPSPAPTPSTTPGSTPATTTTPTPTVPGSTVAPTPSPAPTPSTTPGSTLTPAPSPSGTPTLPPTPIPTNRPTQAPTPTQSGTFFTPVMITNVTLGFMAIVIIVIIILLANSSDKKK